MKGLSDTSRDEYLATDTGVVVYLESTDDVFIFKKWFGELLSKIQFESISGERANGGCGAIIKFFEEQSDSAFAYGVVDRDVLLRNINSTKYPDCKDLWWNTDDADFYSTQPFGEKIFILNRWELENYLLHPEALQKLLNNKTLGTTPLTSATDVANKIIENESDIVAVTLLSTLGRGTVNSMRHSQNCTGGALLQSVKTTTLASSTDIREHTDNIVKFAEGKTDSIERWDKLSRMLDGKRTMYRLDKILHSLGGFCFINEYGALAGHIKNMGLVDSSLRDWLTRISTARQG